jgi:uncharacterized SAM-binding protein YcdF (DUF218 family)
MGQVLVVGERPRKADAIVVLSGGTPTREIKAAELFRAGWAPLVVVSRQYVSQPIQELIELGVRPLDFQGESIMVLEKAGVPREKIMALPDPVRITETELRQVVAVARTQRWSRVLLVTTAHHARRVRLVWSREARGVPEGVVVPVADECSQGEDWWQQRRCFEMILHEYLGLLALHLGISSFMH